MVYNVNMPELPEVETIRLGLQGAIVGQEITDVEVLFNKSFNVELERITDFVAGSVVTAVHRRGKVLIIDLDNGYSLLVHLKMTGQLVLDLNQEKISNTKYQIPNQTQSQKSENWKMEKGKGVTKSKDSKSLEFSNSNLEFGNAGRIAGGHPTKSLAGELPDNSTRVVFRFADGSRLFFNDQRKFGWIRLVESSRVENEKFFEKMGPEPLEHGFRSMEFGECIKRSKRPVKAILLDQSTVAGLGNIYVDEALHLAKIHPLRKGQTLTQKEVERLHAAIIEVLEASLGYGGTSFTNYVNAEGKKGDYLRNARVFKREGQPCRECGATIEKIKVAGRGTHICPECQKL